MRRKTFVAMSLKSKTEAGKFVMGGRLQAPSFAGSARGPRGPLSCSLDVSSGGPLIITFAIDLTVDADGRVKGRGTATGANQEIAVTVTGSNKPQQCALMIGGPKRFEWSGKGLPTETGFTADWKARGFGAVVQGTGLPIAPQ